MKDNLNKVVVVEGGPARRSRPHAHPLSGHRRHRPRHRHRIHRWGPGASLRRSARSDHQLAHLRLALHQLAQLPQPHAGKQARGRSSAARTSSNSVKVPGCTSLPGDFTSPSRFVPPRLSSANPLSPAKSAEEGVNLGLGSSLGDLSIPLGAVRAVQPGGETHYEYTQWTNVSDLGNRRFYYRTYGNQAIRVVAMSDLDLNANEVVVIPMDTPPLYQNVASQACLLG